MTRTITFSTQRDPRVTLWHATAEYPKCKLCKRDIISPRHMALRKGKPVHTWCDQHRKDLMLYERD